MIESSAQAVLFAATGQGGLAAPLAAHAHPLVHLNAALNALATVLLVAALWLIRRRREIAHGRTMLGALAVSAAFLTSYLTYHFAVHLTVPFTHPGPVRYVYYAILLSHVLLAMAVPFLAVTAGWLGARSLGWIGPAPSSVDEQARLRARHVRLVRWAYPIWLYVSVTGVLVYAMLYHLWPSAEL
jgi:putative membrane protein